MHLVKSLNFDIKRIIKMSFYEMLRIVDFRLKTRKFKGLINCIIKFVNILIIVHFILKKGYMIYSF